MESSDTKENKSGRWATSPREMDQNRRYSRSTQSNSRAKESLEEAGSVQELVGWNVGSDSRNAVEIKERRGEDRFEGQGKKSHRRL